MIYTQYQHQLNLKCFICDEVIVGAPTSLKETETSTSREKITKKLAKLVGDDFCVIVSEEDVICRRCLTLFNTMDKYEFDIKNVKDRLNFFINKKYGIEEEAEPPVKIQRLNHSNGLINSTINRLQNIPIKESIRKVPLPVQKKTAENQLKHLANTKQRGPVKLYKCIACDFKTTDLNAFEPHSSVCKGKNRVNRIINSNPNPKTVNYPNHQQVGRTTIIRSNLTQFSCQQCEFKTTDRNLLTEHQRNHMKLLPFKCRMCLERFPTREAAQTHAKIHSGIGMKCGICNRQFIKREVFEAHMKTHEKFKSVSQQEVIVMNKSNENTGTNQKPLTDIIKEALSEENQDELIEFHSCNLCSLTFVNKMLYVQHMKTHKNGQLELKENGHSQEISQITEGDLESIFEKMHSENTNVQNGMSGSENILFTTHETGGITYNISIPQHNLLYDEKKDSSSCNTANDLNIKIEPEKMHQHSAMSMPNLSDNDNNIQNFQNQQQQVAENQQSQHSIQMDLDEFQQAAEEQLKFVVDGNGDYMHMDNHILTDADGNQILLQGSDQDQIQQFLQSVGMDGNQVLVQLQENEGNSEAASLQFGDGTQGQMILVQNEHGESQLIDASMLRQNENGEFHIADPSMIPDEGMKSEVIQEANGETPLNTNIYINGDSSTQQEDVNVAI